MCCLCLSEEIGIEFSKNVRYSCMDCKFLQYHPDAPHKKCLERVVSFGRCSVRSLFVQPFFFLEGKIKIYLC